MLCKFCQHEFDDSLTECPYCHKQVDFEPKSLTREERDNFAGTTIEMEGNPGEEGYTKRAEYQEKDSYWQHPPQSFMLRWFPSRLLKSQGWVFGGVLG